MVDALGLEILCGGLWGPITLSGDMTVLSNHSVEISQHPSIYNRKTWKLTCIEQGETKLFVKIRMKT